ERCRSDGVLGARRAGRIASRAGTGTRGPISASERRTSAKRRGRARPAVAVLGRGQRRGKWWACGGPGLEGTLGELSPLGCAPLKQPTRHRWIVGPYACFWFAFLGALSKGRCFGKGGQ